MELHQQAETLVSQMTLEEKAGLLSGADFWHTKAVARLGLKPVMLTDGPHGLRKQTQTADHLGINESVPATCFPTACATACSFDRELMRRVGAAIAEECREEDVAVLLGPGLNIKRSPLCGRNFEYISEDPALTGELAAAFIEGVQSQNVGVSVKHFALNNQETRRMLVDSVVDERALFELYLAGFERAVRRTHPWTVMCSYNRVGGEYAGDSKRLLTDVLRDRFGFDGLVVSDWGAVNDRIAGVRAGLDLEMPHADVYHDEQIVEAVRSGALDEGDVDRCAARVCELLLRSEAREPFVWDRAAHHALAREAAAASAVLLKNEGPLLPLGKGGRVAVIGAFAKSPRYQGAGSSKLTPYRLDSAFDELAAFGVDASYAEGYDPGTDAPDEASILEACRVAEGKDAALLFVGLPDRYESEGFDREKLTMPENQLELIRRVSRVNPNVIAVLAGGSVVDMSWEADAKAILMGYLGGEAGGGGIADVLTGRRCPGGKLAESWPLRLEDNPSFAYFPGYPLTVEYRESLFVGYRYYDKAKQPVRYPFGYGLSYTSFSYSNLRLDCDTLGEGETLNVRCDVTNTGGAAGSEIVQLYVSHASDVMIHVEQELKDFAKVSLSPGETATVSFALGRRNLSYYNAEAAGWRVEGGAYEIRVAASSRDVRLRAVVHASPDPDQRVPDHRADAPCYYDLSDGIRVSDEAFVALLGRPLPAREPQPGEAFTRNSTLPEIAVKPLGRLLSTVIRREAGKLARDNDDIAMMMDRMLCESPLRLLSMSGGAFGPKQVEGLVCMLNGRFFRGLRRMLSK